ncbi:ABC-type phosphate transport system, periplasmic component [Burkholderiales bacterium JOSHI_001]|nr:ABC-type phosphate transport system, periplasmic component [Burkholderiales bacterium JOSHI_001]
MPTSPPPRTLLRLAALAWLLVLGLFVFPSAHADTLRFGGTGSAIGTIKRLAQAFQQVEPGFQLELVPNLGSSGGIKAVGSGAIQLGAASRPLKAEEAATGLRAVEYGRTAFVLATAKDGVQNLTRREVADLYAGRQARWPDGQPVRLVLRPASDADASQLASFSPEVKLAVEAAQAREGMVLGMTDQETVDVIERLPGGLGTASMALLLSEQRRAHALAIDSVAPTLANVENGRYPYTKTMLLVLRADAPAAVNRFVAFIGSAAGRRLLAETGHVLPVPAATTAAAR